jgi:hypothetical protein
MPAINIPADYWTVRPRGFAAFIAPYSEALETASGEVGRAADVLTHGGDAEARRQLGALDTDAGAILAAVATEHDALATTPTGEVLVGYNAGDRLTGYADTDVDATGNIVVKDPALTPPPVLPQDPNAPPAPPPDTQTPPDREPPYTPPPAQPPPPPEQAPPPDATSEQSSSGAGGAVHVSDASAIPPAASGPGNAGEPPEPVTAPPLPIYVTRDELAAVLDALSPTITLLV